MLPNKCIVITGAGISFNAGIPTYRGKGSKNLSVEELKEYIERAEPTLTHYFCKYLHDQGRLIRVYTQNIDGLHQKAGLPDDKVIEFHGNISRPVHFGQSIPFSAMQNIEKDFLCKELDMIYIFGTSLSVAPFCALPNLPSKFVSRIYVDIHPVKTNSYTPVRKSRYDTEYYTDSLPSISTKIKFGKRITTLRFTLGCNKKRYPKDRIIASDCDAWIQDEYGFSIQKNEKLQKDTMNENEKL